MEGATRALVSEAAHTPTPMATIAAAIANSLILRIRLLPCSTTICGGRGRVMPDPYLDRCDGHHEIVDFDHRNAHCRTRRTGARDQQDVRTHPKQRRYA